MVGIRPALPEDVPAMAEINVRAWRISFRGAVPDEVLEAQDRGARIGYFIECVPSVPPLYTAVAGEGDRVVGFVHMGPNRDPDAVGLAEVYGLYVDPEHQRRGVGRLLMQQAVDWITADAGRGATLWTLRDVAATRRFYEAMGWQADGAVKTVPIGGHPLAHVRYRFTMQ